MFADERVASDTVTAVRVPPGIDGKALLKIAREEHDTVLGGGQGKLAGQIFRIGHLGWVEERDIDSALDAVRLALQALGHPVPQPA